ncbi:MAG TPA: hypothetical protein VGM88_30295 [Kofleriaceae bacterium]
MQSPTLDLGPPLDLALGAQQLELPHVAVFPGERDAIAAVATAFASVGAGTRGLDLGAGAAARVAGAGCPILDASIEGHLRTEADDRAIGSAKADVCLLEAGFLIRGRVLATSGIPSFDAHESLWRRPYRGTFSMFEMGIGGWNPDQSPVKAKYEAMVLDFGHGLVTQSDGTETRGIVEIDGSATLFRYRRLVPRQQIEASLLVLEDEGLRSDQTTLGGTALRVYPVRATVDFGRWYAGAAAGVLESGLTDTESSSVEENGKTVSSWSTTIDGRGLPQFSKPGGFVLGGLRGDRFDASAKAERTLYPTFDGGVALDARVSGDVSLALGPHRGLGVEIAPFVAQTTTWTRDAPARTDVTAGARVQVGHHLWRELRIDAIGEAGRSPYARLDGDRTPTPATGAQAIVAISAKRTALKRTSKPRAL